MNVARLVHAHDRPRAEPRVHAGVRRRKVGRIRGLDVWLVDGSRVRGTLDVDWTMGGSSARYSYNPTNEIWIDACLGALDRNATILHEMIEREWMLKRGLSYDDAHDKANEVEMDFRAKLADTRNYATFRRVVNLKMLAGLLEEYRVEQGLA